ncbi:hypothetical protein C1646_751166 [Rhizophagus diaphanus]|nr:hypothetical protein C1646_751166 [Rhizophagus diaphanus] [Rhizophagus sp. MUCL 43196]
MSLNGIEGNFHDKIYPLKEILPNELVNNLLAFYLVPSRKQKYDSIIVNSKHFTIVASWIVIEKEYAICCHSNLDPDFGIDCNGGSSDIELHSIENRWSSHPNSYLDIDIPRNYEVENYEVFQHMIEDGKLNSNIIESQVLFKTFEGIAHITYVWVLSVDRLRCLARSYDDYERLFETDEGYDVIIYAGEDENVKELHALSNILCIRSQYFRTALSNEWVKKKDGKFILEKPTISPNIFKII